MFIISYNLPYRALDNTIELLQINDIFNVFYESPLEITTDNYGYGYVEKDNEDIILKIAFEGTKESLNDFTESLKSILNIDYISIEENNYNYSEFDFPAVHIDDNWVLASPEEDFPDKNKINFISQGAFGTGLHETTQDILKLILNDLNLNEKKLLDIGTGSGILSIASSIVGASEITAVDIRDVKDEVELNASLNGLTNINTVIGNILEDSTLITDNFHWIFINIGGEETKMFMDFIAKHLYPEGKLLVSGLVEWSFNEVKDNVESYGFKLLKKLQSNEWVTAIFNYEP